MIFGGTPLALNVFPQGYDGPMIMILAPGAFLVIGLMIGLFNVMGECQSKKAAAKAKALQLQGGEAV